MVRRRSTVRFRKGAPGQRPDSEVFERRVGPKVGQETRVLVQSQLGEGLPREAGIQRLLEVPRAVWVALRLVMTKIEVSRQ